MVGGPCSVVLVSTRPEMEEREMEKGLLGSGEEPQQQVITRDDSITSNMDVSTCSPSQPVQNTSACAYMEQSRKAAINIASHCLLSTYRQALHVQ